MEIKYWNKKRNQILQQKWKSNIGTKMEIKYWNKYWNKILEQNIGTKYWNKK